MTSKHNEVVIFKLTDDIGAGLPHMCSIEDPIKYGMMNAIGIKDFIADG